MFVIWTAAQKVCVCVSAGPHWGEQAAEVSKTQKPEEPQGPEPWRAGESFISTVRQRCDALKFWCGHLLVGRPRVWHVVSLIFPSSIISHDHHNRLVGFIVQTEMRDGSTWPNTWLRVGAKEVLVPFSPLHSCSLWDGLPAPQSSGTSGVAQKVGNHVRMFEILSLHCIYFLSSGTPGLGPHGFILLISHLLIIFMKCFLDKWDVQWKIHSKTFVFLEHKGKNAHFMG